MPSPNHETPPYEMRPSHKLRRTVGTLALASLGLGLGVTPFAAAHAVHELSAYDADAAATIVAPTGSEGLSIDGKNPAVWIQGGPQRGESSQNMPHQEGDAAGIEEFYNHSHLPENEGTVPSDEVQGGAYNRPDKDPEAMNQGAPALVPSAQNIVVQNPGDLPRIA